MGAIHAVRVLNSSLYSPASFASFLSSAATLNHAHVVALKGAVPDRGVLIHDLPESGNVLYLLQTGAMPSSDPLQWNNCIDIALATASALQYMHNRPDSFPHGHLTAACVLVDRNGVAKVSDAGLFALFNTEAMRKGDVMLKDMHSLGATLLPLCRICCFSSCMTGSAVHRCISRASWLWRAHNPVSCMRHITSF
jgi:serine/threonine protein kinase